MECKGRCSRFAGILTWMQFLKSLGPLGGSKSTPRRPLGGSKSIFGGSLEALGSRLAPLEGSLAVLLASRRAPGAGLEASWAQRVPIWGPFWGHFLGYFWGPSLKHVCWLIFINFGVHFGVVFGELWSRRNGCSPEGATCNMC